MNNTLPLNKLYHGRFRYKNTCIKPIYDSGRLCMYPQPCIFAQDKFQKACMPAMSRICCHNLKFVKDKSLLAKCFGWLYKKVDKEIDFVVRTNSRQ